ncbi:MAG: amidohydrolase family protein [Kangiellaceae bacterium]|jgi:imidazolonepropionase-like amidohydrolase|nr:amidohydrolase family protein [Kangiellaceae bacterium]
MNKLIKHITQACALTLVSATALANDIVPAKKQSQPILIKGATLHTVTDGIKQNHDLLLDNGVIKNIATGIAAPNNALVIDAAGKHVYPGMIGLVSNLGLVEIGAVRATRDASEVGRYTPEVKAHVAYNSDSEVIPTIRSNGLTHVQATPTGNGLNGQSSLMQLDSWNWQDALVKEQTGMHLTWPRVGINKAFWERRAPDAQRKANAKTLKSLHDTFDAIKAYVNARANSKSQALDMRWEAMRPVFAKKVPLFINANDYRQIEQAINFGKKYDLDIVIVGARDADMALDLIKSTNTPVIFTAAWGRPRRSDEANDRDFTTPARLEAAGIDYALAIAGSWNIRDLPFAAGQTVANGASMKTALESVTINPARVLGVDDKMGSLSVGKQANIVISKGDIFDHLTHKVEAVFIDGRQIDIDNRHKRLYRKYSEKEPK